MNIELSTNEQRSFIATARAAFPSRYYDPNWKPKNKAKKNKQIQPPARARDIFTHKIYQDHNAHLWAHYAFLRQAIIEEETATEITNENLPESIPHKYRAIYLKEMGPYLSQDFIIREFKSVCPCSYIEIAKTGRRKELVVWRHSLFHALKRYTGNSYPQIARVLQRDHTTAIHAVNSVNYAIQRNEIGRHVSPAGVVFYTKPQNQSDFYQWKKPDHKRKAA